MLYKFSFLISAALLITSCHSNQNDNTYIDEDELGYIYSDVNSADTELPHKAAFAKATPGLAGTINRSFENAPPMIPHNTDGFFPIKINNNICFTCHLPDKAKESGATPLPKTHFTNLRPKMTEVEGKMVFEEQKELTQEDLKKPNNAYFNCSQCHVPQAEISVNIENLFTPEFRNEFNLHESNLKDRLNEGIE